MSDILSSKTCANCGATFTKPPKNTWERWKRQTCCSDACFKKMTADRAAIAKASRIRRQRWATGPDSARFSHGHNTKANGPSLTYVSWTNMKTRCTNPDSSKYETYGGRGIKVCDRWMTFANFLADVGERPSKEHTLDRYPNRDGDYEPGNVRWALQKDQCRNRRSSRPVLRSDGAQFPSMADAAESVGGRVGGVWDVCNGKRKDHCGFGWSYA